MTENDVYWEKKRSAMVAEQIVKRGISDPNVLAVMKRLPRHLFVDSGYGLDPYGDHPLSIGMGQTISQPYIVAYMTEKLCLHGTENVLEIGTGSGYQTAVLSQLSHKVYTAELETGLAQRSKALLDRIGIKNVCFAAGDGFDAWKEQEPFDRIMLTAAVKEMPDAVFSRLREGGILIGPVGPTSFQVLVRVTRDKTGFHSETLLSVTFVPARGRLG